MISNLDLIAEELRGPARATSGSPRESTQRYDAAMTIRKGGARGLAWAAIGGALALLALVTWETTSQAGDCSDPARRTDPTCVARCAGGDYRDQPQCRCFLPDHQNDAECVIAPGAPTCGCEVRIIAAPNATFTDGSSIATSVTATLVAKPYLIRGRATVENRGRYRAVVTCGLAVDGVFNPDAPVPLNAPDPRGLDAVTFTVEPGGRTPVYLEGGVDFTASAGRHVSLVCVGQVVPREQTAVANGLVPGPVQPGTTRSVDVALYIQGARLIIENVRAIVRQ